MPFSEQFECADCFHVGALDIHGGCELCHGQQVMSLEVKQALSFRAVEAVATQAVSA